jgi:predicted nucleotidyltransferase component of viral defense system
VPLSPRDAVELFHLVFLRALVAKGEDKALFALKGGCNLRFYFGSVRYSEDIDLDARVVGRETLRNKVDRLLRAPTVTAPLRTKGIEIADASAPKQTDTTQRWKVGLRIAGRDPVRTKIEFSRRSAIEGARFEATDRDLLRRHGLTSFLAPHYGIRAAIVQKIQALAKRAEPQARDVFDLNLLFARPEAAAVTLDERQKTWAPSAIESAMAISFDEHTARVVAYLDPDQAEPFADRPAWEAIQESVVSRIEALR